MSLWEREKIQTLSWKECIGTVKSGPFCCALEELDGIECYARLLDAEEKRGAFI
jgi:hypothetical protein